MKSLFCLALSAVLLLSPALGADGSPAFSDVPPEAWYAPYVEVCQEEGLLSGVGEGRFDPTGIVNGDEAFVMAARVLWQADGGEGPLPKGPDAQTFIQQMGEEAKTCYFLQDVETASRYAALWSWDGLAYLARRAKEAGFSLDLNDCITYPAQRGVFFRLLAFAAQGLELPALNGVEGVPGTRDQGILRLYRAGILAGSDGYGSFDGKRILTRAEAAAVLARLARPELRMTFHLLPAPFQEGYSLTRLREGAPSMGVLTTGICGLDEGFLTLEGELIPWPEGGTPSYALDCTLDHVYIGAYTPGGSYGEVDMGVMDRDGDYVVPLGAYDKTYPTPDGCFLGRDFLDGGGEQWSLLGPDGSLVAELPLLAPGEENSWHDFNQGVCPWRDPESGLWGYVDREGRWLMAPTWEYASSFVGGYAAVLNSQELCGMVDLRGELILPCQYQELTLFQNSPGYQGSGLFSCVDADGVPGWVSPAGTFFPWEGGERRSSYHNGYCVISFNQHGGAYYLDLNTRRVSEEFDWAGPIGADGRGFVGLDGQVYRIEFRREA